MAKANPFKEKVSDMNRPAGNFIERLRQWFSKPAPQPTKAEVQVCEGIGGNFSYHLRHMGQHESLCGQRIMATQIPLKAWGIKTHLNERWCQQCYDLNQEHSHTKE